MAMVTRFFETLRAGEGAPEDAAAMYANAAQAAAPGAVRAIPHIEPGTRLRLPLYSQQPTEFGEAQSQMIMGGERLLLPASPPITTLPAGVSTR